MARAPVKVFHNVLEIDGDDEEWEKALNHASRPVQTRKL